MTSTRADKAEEVALILKLSINAFPERFRALGLSEDSRGLNVMTVIVSVAQRTRKSLPRQILTDFSALIKHARFVSGSSHTENKHFFSSDFRSMLYVLLDGC